MGDFAVNFELMFTAAMAGDGSRVSALHRKFSTLQ
jgi:hypothetical protein